MNGALSSITTILLAVVGVAILAVLVSRNAQTPQVLKSGGDAFSGILRAAMGPVSGGYSAAPTTFSM